LRLEPNLAGIVVSVIEWTEAFLAAHDEEQNFEVYRYSQIMDELLVEKYRENFSWRSYVLN
jgi:hypothetical protein